MAMVTLSACANTAVQAPDPADPASVPAFNFDMSAAAPALSAYNITPISGLPPTPRTTPEVGDRVALRTTTADDKRINRFTIEDVQGDTVSWRSDAGWSGSSRGAWWFHGDVVSPDGRRKSAENSGDLDAIFPLAVGNASTGRTAVVEMDGERYVDEQGCFVAAEESITVGGEVKETFRIECAHDNSGWTPGEDPQNAWSQQIHWFAPGEGVVLSARMRERGERFWDVREFQRIDG